jgi:uncharacterized lipoprotein
MNFSMNKNHISALLCAFVIALSGCVSTVPVNYAPSSTMSASGAVSVSSFAYAPAAAGKVAPNQVRNTALGSVKFEQNVDLIFRDAVFKELRFMGVKMNDASKDLSGEIEEFLIDDLGYSIDWTLRVKYVIKRDGVVIYKGTKEVKRKTNKFINALGSLNETIKSNIEELVKDAAFASAIK